MQYYVYILSDKLNRTIYTGVTSNLLQRIYQHKINMDPDSFTARYHVHKLVYYEETTDVYAAISREKQIKKWNRARKNRLIEVKNPHWEELYDSLLG